MIRIVKSKSLLNAYYLVLPTKPDCNAFPITIDNKEIVLKCSNYTGKPFTPYNQNEFKLVIITTLEIETGEYQMEEVNDLMYFDFVEPNES